NSSSRAELTWITIRVSTHSTLNACAFTQRVAPFGRTGTCTRNDAGRHVLVFRIAVTANTVGRPAGFRWARSTATTPGTAGTTAAGSHRSDNGRACAGCANRARAI